MKNIIENIEFLQKTFILGEGISYPVQNKIARVMQPQKFNEKELLPAGESPGLYLLKEGELRITNREGMVVEELFSGNFFGEESLLSGEPSELYVQVKKTISCQPDQGLSFARHSHRSLEIIGDFNQTKKDR